VSHQSLGTIAHFFVTDQSALTRRERLAVDHDVAVLAGHVVDPAVGGREGADRHQASGRRCAARQHRRAPDGQ